MIKKVELDFIGFGVNRCATTWIAKCLEEHPNICMSVPKETHFFGRNYYKGFSYLKSCFRNCSPEKTKGEYSPEYMTDPSVLLRIKKHFPEIKLIVCIRDPAERAHSAFWLDKKRGKIGYKNLMEKLKKDPWLYIEKGKYYTYLKKWFDVFPRKNFLILVFEDIKKDPAKFIKKIYKFLGVNDNFVPEKIINRKVMQSSRVSVRLPPINRLLFDIRRYSKKNRVLSKSVPFLKNIGVNNMVKFIFKMNRKKSNSKEIPKPKMDNKTKKYLQEIYKEEINNLEKLIGRDLSIWKKSYV